MKKTNMQFVRIARLGAEVKEVALEPKATVADALRVAGVDTKGFEVRLNGVAVDGTKKTQKDDIITLVPQIKGGRR